MIDCVVSPLGLHRYEVAALDVSVTLPPWQNVVAPEGVIVGVDGNGFTVTVVGADAAEVQPIAFLTVTL